MSVRSQHDAAGEASRARRRPAPLRVVVHLLLAVVWAVALVAGCIESLDLCDIGAGLGGGSGHQWTDARYGECIADAEHRRTRVGWGLSGLAVISLATVVWVNAPHGAGRHDPQ